MKETLISIGILGIMVSGFFALKRAGLVQLIPSLPAASQNASMTKQHPSTFGNRQGVTHDKTANVRHGSETAGEGQSEGNSEDGDQPDQEFTSIYHQKSEQKPEPARSSVTREKKKVVHGVPVQAWISSQRNAISLAEEAPLEDKHLRVYLQCLELKRGGPQYVGKAECERLFSLPEEKPSI